MRCVFHKNYPAEPRRMQTEDSLLECPPQINRASDRFLRSVVEVVSETRPDMAFQLNGGAQSGLSDNDHIPLFCGPIEPGKFDPCSKPYFLIRKTCSSNEVAKYRAKSVKMSPARNFASRPRIDHTSRLLSC